MRSGVIIAGCLLAGFASAAGAQSFSNRIYLGATAQQPTSSSADFAVAFIGSPPVCPEGHGALQISGDAIWLLRSPARPNTGRDFVGGVSKPVDDETYQYAIAAYDCVIDLTLRAQVYRDGRWVPLLVPQSMRPSRRHRTSPQEVRNRTEKLAEALRPREGMTPQARAEARQAWLHSASPLARLIRIQQQTGGLATFFAYEAMPENCVNAFGEYRLDQNGVTFRFPTTNTSDDYNRFDAELTRIDDFRSQFALSRGDCRVEITIGKAMRDRGRWLSIPIASIARSR